jgi:quercetin dioxygenase-like cupin family protein
MVTVFVPGGSARMRVTSCSARAPVLVGKAVHWPERFREGTVPADTRDEFPRQRPHQQSLAAPYLEFDLTREIEQLHRESTWESGRNAKTLVKHEDLRIVLMALQAGSSVPVHQSEGRLSIQVLAGRVHVRAEGRTFDLRPGSLLALDQALPHDVGALEESAFLLTIAWPGRPS